MKKKALLKGAVALGLAGLGGYALAVSRAKEAPPHPWFTLTPQERLPLVFAHRGGQGLWPANTRLAMEQAVQLGADVLDVDVQLSRDGALMAIHDDTLEHTTNGRGAVADLTRAELEGLDAGYRFSPDGGASYPYRGQGVGVPSLEELFEAFPRHRFVVEVKAAHPKAARELARLARHYHKQHQVIVGTFRHHVLQEVRQVAPELATMATPSEVTRFVVMSWLGLERTCSPPFHSLAIPDRYLPGDEGDVSDRGIPVMTRRLVTAAHRRGVAVHPWTLNDPEDLRRAVELGVDGINTDYPDRLLKLLGRIS